MSTLRSLALMKLTIFFLLSIVANGQSITSLLTPATMNTEHKTRQVEIPGHFYIVEYAIQQCGMSFVPTTYPPGPTHYAATVSVFEVVSGSKQAIDKPFDGQYTDGECFEDNAVTLTERALKAANALTPEVAAAFNDIRVKRAFESQPLYQQRGEVLEITSKGKRDLKAIVIDGKTVWGEVPVAKDQPGLNITSGSGTITGYAGTMGTHAIRGYSSPNDCVMFDGSGNENSCSTPKLVKNKRLKITGKFLNQKISSK